VVSKICGTALIIFSLFWRSSAAADGDLAAAASPESAEAAIAQATSAIADARAAGNLWLETPRLLAHAIEQSRQGRYADAAAAAEIALHEATMAENQAKLERARYLLEVEGVRLGSAERDSVRVLLRQHDGAAALAAIQDALAERKTERR